MTVNYLWCLTILSMVLSTFAAKNDNKIKDDVGGLKLEVYDGVYLNFPRSSGDGASGKNASDKLLSIEVNLGGKDLAEGRGNQNKHLMERLLPMFIVPFLIQSTIIPLFLSSVKFMLFKSLMVGKLALALIALNAFRNSNNFKGRQEKKMADVHYGYHGNGMEEYGAYIN